MTDDAPDFRRLPLHAAIDHATAALLDLQHVRRRTAQTDASMPPDELADCLDKIERHVRDLAAYLATLRDPPT